MSRESTAQGTRASDQPLAMCPLRGGSRMPDSTGQMRGDAYGEAAAELRRGCSRSPCSNYEAALSTPHCARPLRGVPVVIYGAWFTRVTQHRDSTDPGHEPATTWSRAPRWGPSHSSAQRVALASGTATGDQGQSGHVRSCSL